MVPLQYDTTWYNTIILCLGICPASQDPHSHKTIHKLLIHQINKSNTDTHTVHKYSKPSSVKPVLHGFHLCTIPLKY